MFRITGGKGFHITFENGWTVSVQFGPGNYCANYDRRIGTEDSQSGEEGSIDAECAVFKQGESLYPHLSFDGDTVKGHLSAKEVLGLMNWAASQPTGE